MEKATLDREKEIGLFVLYKLSKSLAVHNIAPFKGTCCYAHTCTVITCMHVHVHVHVHVYMHWLHIHSFLCNIAAYEGCATCIFINKFSSVSVDQLLPYCYSTNASVAAYAMGVMTNITIATSGVGGALDSSAEVVEVGSMVTESLMVMDVSEMTVSTKHGDNPFKVAWWEAPFDKL